MDRNQVQRLKTWFDEYVKSFYGSDEYINANIKLKEDHSRRTCCEMQYLTTALNLDENKSQIAEAIALLHDIGRFEQFVKYRTYNDPASINHALLGLDILEKTNLLDGIEPYEKQIIETAVKYHGVKQLPDNLNGDFLLFAKLIRDADKLDIYYVVTDYYKQYAQNPADFRYEIEFPDEPTYSKVIIENILSAKRVNYNQLQTWNDARLLQLSWVYDVNFTPTLKRIRQRQFIEQILGFLPKTADIDNVRKKIFEYINQRIEQEPS